MGSDLIIIIAARGLCQLKVNMSFWGKLTGQILPSFLGGRSLLLEWLIDLNF